MPFFPQFFHIVFLLLISAFAFSAPKSNIIGGTNSTVPYSWMVSIQDDTGHFCGGVLIHEQFVLTAAHCLEDVRVNSMSLLIGELSSQPTTTTKFVKADWYIQHPLYNNESLTHDIAIIKLKESSTKTPVLFLKSLSEVTQNEPLKVMGWGLTKDGDYSSSPTELREVDVRFQSESACQNAYADIEDGYWQYSFCAGELSGGKDSCTGDSGGPIVRAVNNGHELAGLVSWGYGCGLPEYFGVYTNVPAFIPWIKQRINGASIVGNKKIGFMGFGRSKPETMMLINASSESVNIGQYKVSNEEGLNFEIDQNNWLFEKNLPANSECQFSVNALGYSVGENNGVLKINLNNENVLHNLNSKVLQPLDIPTANLPWPMFSGTKSRTTFLSAEHSEPWYGVNLGGDGVVLSSGNISADERSVLLTYLNGPQQGEELYLRFDAKVDAEFPDGLYPLVNEKMLLPVSINQETPHLLQMAGSLNQWFSYQLPLEQGVNHVMFIYRKDGEFTRGSDRALLKNLRVCTSIDQMDDDCSTAEGHYSNEVIKTLDDYPESYVLTDICTPISWPQIQINEGESVEPQSNKKSSSGAFHLVFVIGLFALIRPKKHQNSGHISH